MLNVIHLQITIFTLISLIYLFLALTERYCSSDIREEESVELSKYYLINGGLHFFFLMFFSSLILFENIYLLFPDIFLNSIPMILLLFIIFYFGLISRSISSEEVTEIKKVKLADELYLDRTEDLNFSDFFMNRYKFNAMMIKKYGKEMTAGYYSLVGLILFIISISIFYYFLPIDFFCFYPFIFIVFIAFSIYGYKKNKENIGKAIQLASKWNYDDFKKMK